jgi:hypothetical protein
MTALQPRGVVQDLRHHLARCPFLLQLDCRGVSERALQRFLGHASVQSTRRYARLADNALVEVLRPPAKRHDATRRQVGEKVQRTNLSEIAAFGVGPPGFEPGGKRKKRGK